MRHVKARGTNRDDDSEPYGLGMVLKVASSILLAVAVLAVAGCGDGGSDSTGQTIPDPPASADNQQNGQTLNRVLQNTYDVARDVCASSGVKKVAREFGVPASNPEAVADAYANGVSTGEYIEASRDGCLEGLVGPK